ncbi:SulP family inorganic anion transporter [Staphylococcus warneri]|uniref:SulP family inorganic anion transporter n=1 Tax=Staphylococcus warneri TaxID=1292 RepID=UPI000D1F09AE|nr:SulP family inorganic anion transporter [Staphylococcus warneri]PTI92028.1 SulP family inorganic anion transporter [Staphylococcus warneri]
MFTYRQYLKQWQGKYQQNILSGILMGLALLPVSIAFSFIVHVKPSIGLMSCGLMMCLISIFGKRVSMVSGPSSGISIIGGPLVNQYGTHFLFLATMMMGMMLIILGLLHIDQLLKYIPNTVVIGFMNALGILLLSTQIKYIFGKSMSTYIVACLTFIIIYLAGKWIKSIPAPLIAIFVITLLTTFIHPHLQYVYDLASIHFKMPSFAIFNLSMSIEAWIIIFKYALTMTIISVIQTNLTTHMVDMISNTESHKDKEIIGQGISNFIVGSIGGYGSSGLVGQSKFNYNMGATSRLSTLITGLFLLLCMVVLGPIVGLIPMVVLASVLVTVSLSTFDRRTFKYIQSSPIQNASVILLTMVLILWTHNLAVGVIIGPIFYYLMNYFIKKVG